LLEVLGAPYSVRDQIGALEGRALDLLKKIGTKLLFIDEVHHLLAGSQREQRRALNLLKFVANDLKIVVVVVGTQDAFHALQTDAQVESVEEIVIPLQRLRHAIAVEFIDPLQPIGLLATAARGCDQEEADGFVAKDIGVRMENLPDNDAAGAMRYEDHVLLRQRRSRAVRACGRKITQQFVGSIVDAECSAIEPSIVAAEVNAGVIESLIRSHQVRPVGAAIARPAADGIGKNAVHEDNHGIGRGLDWTYHRAFGAVDELACSAKLANRHAMKDKTRMAGSTRRPRAAKAFHRPSCSFP
jgi:hypothetical protein